MVLIYYSRGTQHVSRANSIKILAVLVLCIAPVIAKERRSKAPRFGADSFRGVFFEDVSSTVANPRPSVQELRGIKPQAAGPSEPESKTSGGEWDALAQAQSIEDEIKRQKLLFDSDTVQMGKFKSGGYAKARLELSIMATLFGVITEYQGDIRWKKDAKSMRDLLAASAGRCNSGAIEVFNECKTRKEDIEDLLRGSKVNSPKVKEESDWSQIADRSLLMEYLDVLSKEKLPELTNTDTGVKKSPEDVTRLADMVALTGHVLIQDGMDEADDDEYKALAEQMKKAATAVSQAVERGDADGARRAVGAINQSCDACHENYR